MTESTWYDLVCSDCGYVYAALEPNASEIETPICQSCRLLGEDQTDTTYPLSRGD